VTTYGELYQIIGVFVKFCVYRSLFTKIGSNIQETKYKVQIKMTRYV